MSVHKCQEFLDRVASGEVLKMLERRLAIQYLLATQPGITTYELSSIFHVTEKTILSDKQSLRQDKAKYLKGEMQNDISLVIADIALDFERQVSDLEKSKKSSELGKRAYVDHCNAIFNMRLQMIRTFQDIGYLPKNLGAMTVEKFEYKAIVHKDGTVATLSTAEISSRKALEAEFEDIPQAALPAGSPSEPNSSTPSPVHGAEINVGRPAENHSGEAGIAASAPEAIRTNARV